MGETKKKCLKSWFLDEWIIGKNRRFFSSFASIGDTSRFHTKFIYIYRCSVAHIFICTYYTYSLVTRDVNIINYKKLVDGSECIFSVVATKGNTLSNHRIEASKQKKKKKWMHNKVYMEKVHALLRIFSWKYKTKGATKFTKEIWTVNGRK